MHGTRASELLVIVAADPIADDVCLRTGCDATFLHAAIDDHRLGNLLPSNLFAGGVVLYQLRCNGQHPYPNSRPIAGDPVIDPSTIRSDSYPRLAEFLVKACASLRESRFGALIVLLCGIDA